jgi:DNA-directed RNA polymerase specialized sigma24 family protein
MNYQQSEVARFYWLLMEVLAGRRLPAELLEDSLFLSRAGRICRHIARGTYYDPLDMFQDACVKLLTFFSKPRGDDEADRKISFEDVNSFFKLYVAIAGNLLTDYFRKNGKRYEQEVSLSANIAAALKVAAPGASPYDDCLFSEFAECLKTLPKCRQQAIALRQKGFSYEQITVKLGGKKKLSKVAIRNWVVEALDEFFEDNHSQKAKKVVGL